MGMYIYINIYTHIGTHSDLLIYFFVRSFLYTIGHKVSKAVIAYIPGGVGKLTVTP